VPGAKEIENYEPSDEGWGVVIGPFMQKPEPKLEHDNRDAEAPAGEDPE
jgi:hypothetical protein